MAAPVVESVSTALGGVDATVTIAKPSGTAEGDWLICVYSCRTAMGTPTLPSGWTQVEYFNGWGGFTGATLIAKKQAGASEPSDYTFGRQFSIGRHLAGILRISGADDVDVSAIQDNSATTTPSDPGDTTTVDDALVLRVYNVGNSVDINSGPASTTEEFRIENGGSGTDGIEIGVYSETQASAGSTGTKSVTLSAGVASCTATVAIAPGAAVGGGSKSRMTLLGVGI